MASGWMLAPGGAFFYVWHAGDVTLADGYATLQSGVASMKVKAGTPHLLDLQFVHTFERPPVGVMQLNADISRSFDLIKAETMLVMHAPHATARQMARLMSDFWDGSGVVLPRIAETEEAALAILGRSEERFADLGLARDGAGTVIAVP